MVLVLPPHYVLLILLAFDLSMHVSLVSYPWATCVPLVDRWPSVYVALMEFVKKYLQNVQSSKCVECKKNW